MKRAKNKKNNAILVTAGPTWVPIDKVRVITNIFSGKLGFLIAKEAAKKGFEVRLLLGPGRIILPDKKIKNLEIIRYKYFEELYNLLKKAVLSKKYKILVHSAAIADYAPKPVNAKIKSGKSNFILKLKPTIKIADQIKKWDANIFLIKFKLEVGISPKKLIDIAYKSMKASKADLMVANEFSQSLGKDHKAYLIDQKKNIHPVCGKEQIAKKIMNVIKNI